MIQAQVRDAIKINPFPRMVKRYAAPSKLLKSVCIQLVVSGSETLKSRFSPVPSSQSAKVEMNCNPSLFLQPCVHVQVVEGCRCHQFPSGPSAPTMT